MLRQYLLRCVNSVTSSSSSHAALSLTLNHYLHLKLPRLPDSDNKPLHPAQEISVNRRWRKFNSSSENNEMKASSTLLSRSTAFQNLTSTALAPPFLSPAVTSSNQLHLRPFLLRLHQSSCVLHRTSTTSHHLWSMIQLSSILKLKRIGQKNKKALESGQQSPYRSTTTSSSTTLLTLSNHPPSTPPVHLPLTHLLMFSLKYSPKW